MSKGNRLTVHEFSGHQAHIVNMTVRDGMKDAEREKWRTCKSGPEEKLLLQDICSAPLAWNKDNNWLSHLLFTGIMINFAMSDILTLNSCQNSFGRGFEIFKTE